MKINLFIVHCDTDFNNTHKNNIFWCRDGKRATIFERGKRFLFEEYLHTLWKTQFNSWEDGVRSVRCLWTAQQHGVLQVGVSQNVTHLEIHGVEQWTFQTSKVSIKWGERLPLHHRWLENTQPTSTLAQIRFCPLSSLSEFPHPFSISGPL